MRVAVITVAGLSSRFGESLGREVVKCLYREGDVEETLLGRLVRQLGVCDAIVVVGGYGMDELRSYVHDELSAYADKIRLVENPRYADYGSGYSLYLGLREALEVPFDEVVFVEGDLFLGDADVERVVFSEGDVITYNRKPIEARTAVALYFDVAGHVRYVYDTGHEALCIPEPFLGVYNSGQVWKFANRERVLACVDDLGEDDWAGTNLTFIGRYFGEVTMSEVSMIPLERWMNCNTVGEYRQAFLRGDV